MSTTPLMNLVLPDVGVTAGPTWATLLNAAMNLIDSHDHSSGKGSRIPTAGLNINADLELNGFNLTEILATVFNSQAGTLGQTLTSRVYVVGNELYFNDGVGNAVKITNAGAVNVSGSNGIGGDYGGGNPAALNFVEATSTYEFYENPAGSSRGNILFGALDMNSRFSALSNSLAGNLTITSTDNTFIILVDTSAGRTITLPDPTLGKRLFIIKDKTGTSQTNAITLARFGSETIDGVAASKSLSKNFGSWYVISDGTNWWVLKDDVAVTDKTSVTVFDGSTTLGTDAVATGAFASPTLSAASFTEGTAVSRSTNDLTFPFTGKYKIVMHLPKLLTGSGSGRDVIVRVRNTTDSTTADKESTFAPTAEEDALVTMFVNVTDVVKVYQVQWISSGTATVGNTTVGGETGPRWRIVITKLKDT